MPVFHIVGIIACFTELLKRFVRKFIPLIPKCLSMIGEMPSGPMALEFLEFLIAFNVCCVVMRMSGSGDFFQIFLRRLLNSFVGLVEELGVYCLLNWVASFLLLL